MAPRCTALRSRTPSSSPLSPSPFTPFSLPLANERRHVAEGAIAEGRALREEDANLRSLLFEVWPMLEVEVTLCT
jgi:hypothetical protein